MVPLAGVEPARGCPHKILSLARLPIPSQRLIYSVLLYYQKNKLFQELFINMLA